MDALLCTVCAASLVLGGVRTAGAATPAEATAGPQAPTPDAVLTAAEGHWRAGDWKEARQLLEPLAEDEPSDSAVRVRALEILADSTIQDGTLSESARRQLASRYVERLMKTDRAWQLPGGIYSPALAELETGIRGRRRAAEADQCIADRNACRADLTEARDDHGKLQKNYDDLQRDYQDQDVEIRTQERRSRAWALIPLGVGHFYGARGPHRARNIALGTTFAVLEVGLGATGLGLILKRTIGDGCTRTNGFATGSLHCTTDDRDGVLRRRKAEEAIGWVFLGTVILDVILAQILFEDLVTTGVETKKRSELGAQPSGPQTQHKRRERRADKRRAKVRPMPAVVPKGGGIGVGVRY